MTPCLMLLLLLPLVASQSFHWGYCPSPAVQANFSMEQFLGVWYEHSSLTTKHQELRECTKGTFVQQDSSSVMVTITTLRKTKRRILYQNAEEPAKMEFSTEIDNVFLDAILPKIQWWVLMTDYNSTAVVYSCQEYLDIFYMQYAWIISRTRTLPIQAYINAKEVLLRAGIDVTNMIMVNQSSC